MCVGVCVTTRWFIPLTEFFFVVIISIYAHKIDDFLIYYVITWRERKKRMIQQNKDVVKTSCFRLFLVLLDYFNYSLNLCSFICVKLRFCFSVWILLSCVHFNKIIILQPTVSPWTCFFIFSLYKLHKSLWM